MKSAWQGPCQEASARAKGQGQAVTLARVPAWRIIILPEGCYLWSQISLQGEKSYQHKMKFGTGRNEFTAAAQVEAAVAGIGDALLPRDGDGCIQEGSRSAVRGGSFSLGLLCPVLLAEVPKKLLEVMLEVIPGERFWGVFQLFYVNMFSIAVLHHGPLLCAGFT